MPQSHGITTEELKLTASDGYPLAASLFHAPSPRALLLVGAATGAPRGFYRRFAEHAAGRGFSTLTLDYRGVGESRPDDLKGFEMHYLDWAWKDLAAAQVHLEQQGLPLFMVGHSFGGHAFGSMPGHARIRGLYTFGTGAGWHGWMPGIERWRVWAMWNLAAPLIVKRKGYLAWRKLGMGEDLPAGVYHYWRRWCSYPRYFFDDPREPQMGELYARVKSPIVAANSLDDLWAQPRSRDTFMAGYCNSEWQGRDIDPLREGLGQIGHMGYFRPQAAPLWDEALNWFEEQLQK